jgi:peptidoglycan/xylan/chitin deacetylase (PgdA/CDA1 family)
MPPPGEPRQADAEYRVAITIDVEHPDRPHCPPGTIEAILDALADTSVRATFFIQGRWAAAYPDTTERIVRDGHRVGNHAFYHARLDSFTEAGLIDDIQRAEKAISSISGADPRPWFRCPFGAGAADPRIQAVIGRLGYRQVGWHVDARDWDPGRSATNVADSMVADAVGRDGYVILLHSWPSVTSEALRRAVAALRTTGATFVTLDELDGDLLPIGGPDGPPGIALWLSAFSARHRFRRRSMRC